METGSEAVYCAGFKAGQSKDGGIGLERDLSQTINAKMSALEPTMVRVFAQNTRDEVRIVNGDWKVAGALASQPGMKQTNYLMSIDSKRTTTSCSGIDCLTPSQPQTHRIYSSRGAWPSICANTGPAGQNQQSVLKQHQIKNEKGTDKIMKAEVRRLTTTEVQRLQGFDEGHLDVNDQGDSAKYAETGNSWAVNNARFVIGGIHKTDEKIHGKKRGFKYGTISSGVEAHTQASVGFGDKAVFFSEISPAPCGVLAAHYPDVQNLGDMTLVDFDPEKKVVHNHPYDGYQEPDDNAMGFKPFKTPEPVEIPCEHGEINLVSGGTPCQSFSVAGKRAGGAEGSGTRSSLAFQLPRIGKAVGAEWLLWENVPGAFSSNGGRDFTWFIYRVMEAGYSLAWRTMDAQFVRTDKHPRAVPQRRRRIWMVAYRGRDWRVPCEALFEPMRALGTEPPRRTVGVGYLSKVAPVEKQDSMTELQEFEKFYSQATRTIVDALVEKGVCESPDERRRELELAEKTVSVGGDDLFGGDLFGTGAAEEKHQGRGLREKDLELRIPDSADIRGVPQVEIFKWAKSVCNDVCYFGELFKSHNGDATVDDLSDKMLENIGNAGFLCDGLVCTMKMPEWNAGVTEETIAGMPRELAELYDGDVCGLSDVLEPNPDPKYKLSWRACYGILRRAVKRGKKLPLELGYALVDRIIEQAPYVKWVAENGRDTKKNETDLTECEAAKIAFDDWIEAEWSWSDVEAKKSDADDEPKTDEDNFKAYLDDADAESDNDKLGNRECDYSPDVDIKTARLNREFDGSISDD